MNTHNIPFSIRIIYPKSAAMGLFSKELKDESETAVVNEPSVFEPLKFNLYAFMHDRPTKQILKGSRLA